MFKSLKLTCDEATTICDKNQYGEARFFDKLKLNLHFISCKICMLYTKQNTKLSDLYKGYATKCRSIQKTLTEAEKEALKKSLNL